MISFQSSLVRGATVNGADFHFLHVSCLPFVSTIRKFSIFRTGNSKVLWIQITPRLAPHSLQINFPTNWMVSSWYFDPLFTNVTLCDKCLSMTTWCASWTFFTSSDQHIKWSHLMQRSSNCPVLTNLRLEPSDFNCLSKFASSWNLWISCLNLSGLCTIYSCNSKGNYFIVVGFHVAPKLLRLYGNFPAFLVVEDLKCHPVHYFRHKWAPE